MSAAGAVEPSGLEPLGGLALLLLLLALRELAAGALREAGKDAWEASKRRVRRGRGQCPDGGGCRGRAGRRDRC